MPDIPQSVAELLAIEHPASLGPGAQVVSLRDRVAAAAAELSPECAAGLWLRFDFLHESHEISQECDTPEGMFWHAIMHRREPDAWNSKYWWRQVGNHPVIAQLRQKAPAVGYEYTTPESFVDYCERVRGSGSTNETAAKRVQQLEWKLLFDYCMQQAAGE